MASLLRAAVLRRAAVPLRLPYLSQNSVFPSLPETSGASAPLLKSFLLPFPLRNFVSHFNSSTFRCLTDTRLPKRRPGTKPRKKRASLRPKGPFVWIQAVPGEPVCSSQPNLGSVKSRGRKEKKRAQQRLSFIAAEVEKRKAAFAEHKKKKAAERIERKMAAVAREKAWAERLKQLKQLETAKKAEQTL